MIDAKTLQSFLNAVGRYGLETDGWFFEKSYTAARAYLQKLGYPATWPDQRTYVAIQQLFLNSTMNAGLLVDGILGRKTLEAESSYAKTLLTTTPKVTVRPKPATWWAPRRW